MHGDKTYNSFVCGNTDEDQGLWIESFAVINLRGTDEDPGLRIESFGLCSNKFTWCFHKQNYNYNVSVVRMHS